MLLRKQKKQEEDKKSGLDIKISLNLKKKVTKNQEYKPTEQIQNKEDIYKDKTSKKVNIKNMIKLGSQNISASKLENNNIKEDEKLRKDEIIEKNENYTKEIFKNYKIDNIPNTLTIKKKRKSSIFYLLAIVLLLIFGATYIFHKYYPNKESFSKFYSEIFSKQEVSKWEILLQDLDGETFTIEQRFINNTKQYRFNGEIFYSEENLLNRIRFSESIKEEKKLKLIEQIKEALNKKIYDTFLKKEDAK